MVVAVLRSARGCGESGTISELPIPKKDLPEVLIMFQAGMLSMGFCDVFVILILSRLF